LQQCVVALQEYADMDGICWFFLLKLKRNWLISYILYLFIDFSYLLIYLFMHLFVHAFALIFIFLLVLWFDVTVVISSDTNDEMMMIIMTMTMS